MVARCFGQVHGHRSPMECNRAVSPARGHPNRRNHPRGEGVGKEVENDTNGLGVVRNDASGEGYTPGRAHAAVPALWRARAAPYGRLSHQRASAAPACLAAAGGGGKSPPRTRRRPSRSSRASSNTSIARGGSSPATDAIRPRRLLRPGAPCARVDGPSAAREIDVPPPREPRRTRSFDTIAEDRHGEGEPDPPLVSHLRRKGGVEGSPGPTGDPSPSPPPREVVAVGDARGANKRSSTPWTTSGLMVPPPTKSAETRCACAPHRRRTVP